MTWGEAKVLTLQRLFAVKGDTATEDRLTLPYIKSMPGAANEGLFLLMCACGLETKTFSFPTGEAEGKENAYDMREIAPDFRSFTGKIYINRDGKGKSVCRSASLQPPYILILPSYVKGEVTVPYEAVPKAISSETPDDYVLPLVPEAETLLPLYMASQLFKDDDMRQSVQLRNEFEEGLSRMNTEAVKRKNRFDVFESVKGWW